MKRETLRHPKTLHLASLLGCDRPTALGYLILMWDFAAEYSPRGDIGKFPDGAISGACDWKGESSAFVGAMIDSRWVDRDHEHRLLVHDWPDHCERWVHLKLQKIGQDFIEPPVERSIEGSVEKSTEASCPRDQSNPIQSKPFPDRTGNGPDRVVSKNGNSDRDERADAIASNNTLKAASEVAVDSLDALKLEGGAFSVLKTSHLANTQVLFEWFQRQLSLADPVCNNTRADLLFVIAAGIWAAKIPESQVRKSRVAAFVNVVHRGRWRKVARYFNEAIKKLTDFEHKQEASDETPAK